MLPANQQSRQSSPVDGRRGDGDDGEAKTEVCIPTDIKAQLVARAAANLRSLKSEVLAIPRDAVALGPSVIVMRECVTPTGPIWKAIIDGEGDLFDGDSEVDIEGSAQQELYD